MLVINPAAMGALRIAISLLPEIGGDQIKHARVQLRYVPSSGAPIEEEVMLEPGAEPKTWFKPTGEIADPGVGVRTPGYTYQVTYVMAASEIAMPPVPSTADTLVLPGPFTKVLSFGFYPQGDFTSITADVVYNDPIHQYELRHTVVLRDLKGSDTLNVPVMEGGPEEVSWSGRISLADGSVTPLVAGKSGPGSIFLGTAIPRWLVVQVLPDVIDFDKDVQIAIVSLSHHDPAVADERQEFVFSKSAKTAQTWRVPLAAGALDKYDVDIQYRAWDPSKSSEVHLKDVADQILLLDRQSH
jgi:hypothetical protein